MGMGNRILACLALLLLVPLHAQAAPRPADVELIDVANDDGSALGVIWNWDGEPAETDSFSLELRINDQLLEHYALTESQQQLVTDSRNWLIGEIGTLKAQQATASAEMAAANDALNMAIINKQSNSEIGSLRRDYWAKYKVARRIDKQITSLHEQFAARTFRGEDLRHKALTYEFLKQALARDGWIEVLGKMPMSEIGNKQGNPDLFGITIKEKRREDEAAMLFASFDTLTVPNPETAASNDSATGLEQFNSIPVKLVPDIEYRVRMTTFGMSTGMMDPAMPEETRDGQYTLGSGTPRGNAFDWSKWNNLLFAMVFSMIILTFIILARRNPNMFIRRIAGLEAVDEAIGRATEMGKPVLYLCGMQSLSELPTLAAINILGRVAGKIADYESDLIVPNRDPVVQTVAQEVVKEGYLNAGRPDAYRDDNIFFLTDDQFSFTAATCGIMMRDKPAAIFLMGYYYAESLLLAETGADTGAIQIAGTDAEHQLPFFIVTCDYTLIGEELYAASAYLSREPMLLGSLKGQDIAKAFMLVLILLQALMFIFSAEFTPLKDLVTPL